jgi:hypothetical protein
MRRPGILVLIAVAAAAWLVAEKTILQPVVTRGDIVWRVATDGDSVPRSIADAESGAQGVPRSTEPDSISAGVEPRTQNGGTAERRCVDVKRENAIRSGDFFAGSFQRLAEFWHQPYPKLWWTAVHTRPLRTPVQFTLRIARIDTTGVAFFYASPTMIVRKLEPYFSRHRMGWISWTELPSRGTWMFVARMHNEWGCFVFTV